MATLRIGTLGAARITPTALLRPARAVEEVEVVAVAARDPARAAKWARRHGIETVHESYGALIEDPAIDAIYNPLPNSHQRSDSRHGACRSASDISGRDPARRALASSLPRTGRCASSGSCPSRSSAAMAR